MNEFTRRDAIKITAATAAAGIVTLMTPSPAAAEGVLIGTFYVYCEKCHQVDKVEDHTRNHTCENQKCKHKTVDGGTGYLVCPDGHWRDNKVEAITKAHACAKKLANGQPCAKECEGQKVVPAKPEA
jgi:hypothetical protein